MLICIFSLTYGYESVRGLVCNDGSQMEQSMDCEDDNEEEETDDEDNLFHLYLSSSVAVIAVNGKQLNWFTKASNINTSDYKNGVFFPPEFA